MTEQAKKRTGRPPLPEPKGNPVTVRLTDAMLAAVEKARGSTPRSVWIEEAITARLAGPL